MIKSLKSVLFQTIKRFTPLWFRSYSVSFYWRLLAFVDRLRGYPKEKAAFKRTHGYQLNLKSPTTFNEKVVWKKLYDRNPLLPIVADKYRCRDYVERKLGADEANSILVPLLYVTDNPESIPWDTLIGEYIIKPNHGSQMLIIVGEDDIVDRQVIIAQCKRWLRQPYNTIRHEWAYQPIKRKIVIERLLRQADGSLPVDFKFFVFHGRCHFVQVDHDRRGHHTRSLYDAKWTYIDGALQYPKGRQTDPPEQLSYMISLAERLGCELDFARVDLYSIQNRIYFGEITNYPGSGLERFNPISLDHEFGSKWNIVPRYWEKEADRF